MYFIVSFLTFSHHPEVIVIERFYVTVQHIEKCHSRNESKLIKLLFLIVIFLISQNVSDSASL